MYAQLSAAKQWSAHNPTLSFILQTVIGANLIALLAQVAIPLPYVAITGQSLGVTLVGFALGRKAGVAAIALYLLEGLAGMPVFAGGRAGLAVLMGPSGGYLFGFLAMAYILGWAADKGYLRSFTKSFGAAMAANIAMFAFGLAQLSLFVPQGTLLQNGLYPFIAGGIVKSILAYMLVMPAYRFFQKL